MSYDLIGINILNLHVDAIIIYIRFISEPKFFCLQATVRLSWFQALFWGTMDRFSGRYNMVLFTLFYINLPDGSLMLVRCSKRKRLLYFSWTWALLSRYQIRAVDLLFLFARAFCAVEIRLSMLNRLDCHRFHQIWHWRWVLKLTVGFQVFPLGNFGLIHILKLTQRWISVLDHRWLRLRPSLKSAILDRLTKHQKVHLLLGILFV